MGLARWSDRLDLHAEVFGDVTGPMGAGSQGCHRPEVVLLLGRCSLEPDEEEVVIQLRHDGRVCCRDIRFRDRRLLRDVPHAIAPFLEKVWISPGVLDDAIESFASEANSILLGRDGQCVRGLFGLERTDLGEVEEPFGVGLGLTCQSGELGESGAGHDDR